MLKESPASLDWASRVILLILKQDVAQILSYWAKCFLMKNGGVNTLCRQRFVGQSRPTLGELWRSYRRLMGVLTAC